MTKLILPIFIFATFLTFAQKKEFTLKESVLKQRALSPDRVNNFLWIPNTDFYSTFSSDWKTIQKSTLSGDKETELAKIDDINTVLKSTYANFFGMSWLSENEILLNDGQTIAKWNVSTKSGSILKNVIENSENQNYHSKSNQLAYTIENNLFIDGKPITKNADKNIVSGQSIARNEFGISGGIFWSESGDILAFYQKKQFI